MKNMKTENPFDLTVLGGGLAGSEAAWQAASRGLKVRLFEMRPEKTTGAHKTGHLAELVCSNSLGSALPDRATGLLKEELKRMNSLLARAAEKTSLPAGNALAVDRDLFAQEVETTLENHSNIHIIREEALAIPQDGPVIVATGPLTSERLSADIRAHTGEENLFFFDAIAPIITLDSINFEIAYRASRYGRGTSEEGDYINCPFTKDEYYAFVEALRGAERIELQGFESGIEQGVSAGKDSFFEGCLPVEVLAGRDPNALAFGPMRPVGLIDPRSGKRPFAVLQLRQDNLAGDLYNLVGFQTNLLYKEQERILRLIPGLENAQFVRFGQMHRNTYISAPGLINRDLQLISRPEVFFAGQLSGVEGYMGNIGTGLAAGMNAAALIRNEPLFEFPAETMLGSLLNYIAHAEQKHFQPMKANFGILPPLENPPRTKQDRAKEYARRSLERLDEALAGRGNTN